MRGKLDALAALSTRKEPPVPIGQWLGEPQNWSGRSGEEKTFLLSEFELRIVGSPASPQVATPTALRK